MPGVLLKFQHKKTLPNQIILELEGSERVPVSVEYEWVPPSVQKLYKFWAY